MVVTCPKFEAKVKLFLDSSCLRKLGSLSFPFLFSSSCSRLDRAIFVTIFFSAQKQKPIFLLAQIHVEKLPSTSQMNTWFILLGFPLFVDSISQMNTWVDVHNYHL
jgi:hypothetical protein